MGIPRRRVLRRGFNVSEDVRSEVKHGDSSHPDDTRRTEDGVTRRHDEKSP